MKIIKNLLLIALFAFPPLVLAEAYVTATKICQEVENVSFPTADQINHKQPLNSQCHAIDYYYGIACKVNFEMARLRAYEEMKKNEIHGSIVLTMLYANGEGVAKNIPLAQKLACKNSFAPAELTARVLHLAELNTNLPVKKFDFCDDITSGYMMGYCADIAEKISAVKRETRLQHIISQWTPQQQFAFTKLKKAADVFANKRSFKEVDLSGTARSMNIIQEEAIQNEDFVQSIEKLEKNKAPTYTSAQLSEEDDKLNSLYQSLQKYGQNGSGWPYGTITKNNIKETQLAWIKYREAWVGFAKIRYPQYPSDSIAAWFTKKRNHMMESLIKLNPNRIENDNVVVLK